MFVRRKIKVFKAKRLGTMRRMSATVKRNNSFQETGSGGDGGPNNHLPYLVSTFKCRDGVLHQPYRPCGRHNPNRKLDHGHPCDGTDVELLVYPKVLLQPARSTFSRNSKLFVGADDKAVHTPNSQQATEGAVVAGGYVEYQRLIPEELPCVGVEVEGTPSALKQAKELGSFAGQDGLFAEGFGFTGGVWRFFKPCTLFNVVVGFLVETEAVVFELVPFCCYCAAKYCFEKYCAQHH